MLWIHANAPFPRIMCFIAHDVYSPKYQTGHYDVVIVMAKTVAVVSP